MRRAFVVLVACLCVLVAPQATLAQESVRPVVLENEGSPYPAPDSIGISVNTVARVEFSAAIDASTVTADTFQLIAPDGSAVVASVITDATDGVATLSPDGSLLPFTTYTMRLSDQIRGRDGQSLVPYESSFTTGDVEVLPGFEFTRTKVADRDSNTSVALGPDGNLYVASTSGEVRRYVLDPVTGLAVEEDAAISLPAGHHVVGIVFDPAATESNLLLWVTYAVHGQDNYTGTVSRFSVPRFGSGGSLTEDVFITGLPHTDFLNHTPNGLIFGPDGLLYQAVGGVTTLGGTPNWGVEESMMSASVIVADVHGDAFVDRPIDVSPPYDPLSPDAPVRLYATGFRNSYDLVWHSNGELYVPINQNSINDRNITTPVCEAAPAVNARPHEMLARVVAGNYYGHPNPSRGECVLNGGNPTSGADPFEVLEYPRGVVPESSFDPSLIYDLRPGGGFSPNGIIEYRGRGQMQNWLVIAYFAGSKIQALRPGDDGVISEEQPILDESGNVMSFTAALDLVEDPRGRLYVADFGAREGTIGSGGAIYMLEPASGVTNSSPVASLVAVPDKGMAPLLVEFDGVGSTDSDGSIISYAWDFGDGGVGSGRTTSHTYETDGTYTVTLEVTDDEGATDVATATVVVGNQAPVVDAGGDQVVLLSGGAVLDGSVDDDGLPEPSSLTTSWSLVSGPGTAVFGDASVVDTTVSFSEEGSYQLRLTASDGELTSSDEVTVTVELEPEVPSSVLFVVGDAALVAGDPAILSRLEGLGYEVTVVDDDAVISSDAQGHDLVVVSATVLSGKVGTAFRQVSLPVITWESWLYDDMRMTGSGVARGYGRTPSQTSLQISDSSHPMAAGLTGSVSITNTGSFVMWGRPASSASVIATVSSDTTKALIFTYEPGDQMVGMTAPGRRVGFFPREETPTNFTSQAWQLFEAAITWAELGPNLSPSASFVAAPMTGVAPLAVELDASGSADPDGSIISYGWSFGDGEVGSGVAASHTYEADGSYTVTLEVTDDEGATDTATATVVVGNQAPLVDAGPDQTIVLSEVATLDGSVTDDGLPEPPTLTVSWGQVSGPGTVTFGDAAAVDTTASFSEVGVYELRLTASDGEHTVSDEVVVTVETESDPNSVLLVVGDTPLSSGDPEVFSRLEGLGYVVTVVDDDQVTSSDAEGHDLVVVSATVLSKKVGTKFRETTLPVVTWESWLYDDLGMTGSGVDNGYGREDSQTTLQIVDSSHPMAAGVSGSVTTTDTGSYVMWGRPAFAASVVATLSSDATKALIFAYQSGDQMVGLAAPHRRVGFFPREDTPTHFTPDAWRLFDAAITWADG